MNYSGEALLSDLRSLEPAEFEQLVGKLWERQGWHTSVTSESQDKGIDIIAVKSEPFQQKQLIQAKRYAAGNKVGRPEVQQYGSLRQQEDNVDTVVIVTTSSFTKQAQEIAQELNVKLVDSETVRRLMWEYGDEELLQEFRLTSNEEAPDTNSEMGTGSEDVPQSDLESVSEGSLSEETESTTRSAHPQFSGGHISGDHTVPTVDSRSSNKDEVDFIDAFADFLSLLVAMGGFVAKLCRILTPTERTTDGENLPCDTDPKSESDFNASEYDTSTRWWLLTQAALYTPIALFALSFIHFAVTAGLLGFHEQSMVVTAPLIACFVSLILGAVVFPVSASKDKAYLAAETGEAKERHPVVIFLLQYFSAGLYAVYYILTRRSKYSG